MLALSALALGACNGKPAGGDESISAQAQEGAYLAPPEPDTVRLDASGVVLSGRGPAASRVRLAQPSGQAVFAPVDAQGRWTIPLGLSAQPRIFGLSVTSGGRTAQAQGYVLVTPRGQAALLRAGGAAVRIDSPTSAGFRAVDFDAGGGLEAAMEVPPKATVILHLDGRQVSEGRADENGRYVVSLQSIRPGAHQLEMAGDGFTDSVTVALGPPKPLAEGPMRSQLTPAGLRLDWLTPGGGVQSTLLPH